MPVYEYKGLDDQGEEVSGIQDAENKSALRQQLQSQGIYTTDIWEGEEGESGSRGREIDLGQLFERVTLRDIAVLTRQLATLLRAGIPLVRALNALTDQLQNQELKRVVSDIRRQVNEGSSLASAIGDHPEHFSDLYKNMVEAGESSGNLDLVLERLTEFLDDQIELRGKIIGAMIYPLLMTLVGAALLGLIFTFVIPKVTQLFEDQGKALPLVTRLLIGVSDLLTNWIFLLVALPTTGLAIAGFVYWKRTPEGEATWDRFVLRIPVVGSLVRMIAVSRFARTLGTLLGSGVPLLTAMDIVKNILGNAQLEDVIADAREDIEEGESIADPLERSGEFPPLVTHMVSVGEQSGQLEEMLDNVAESYDQQVDLRIQALTTLLEPLLIVIMGIGVAIIVFAVMLPLLQLNQTVV
ncbi:MAG: type II secretion system inner membrane protein GspF [Bradymonadaceae bacterium]